MVRKKRVAQVLLGLGGVAYLVIPAILYPGGFPLWRLASHLAGLGLAAAAYWVWRRGDEEEVSKVEIVDLGTFFLGLAIIAIAFSGIIPWGDAVEQRLGIVLLLSVAILLVPILGGTLRETVEG